MTYYRLGLTGYPLAHSLSPRLHAAALRAAGLEGEYRLYPVPPLPDGEGGLRELIEGLRGGNLHGLNVTIPHKTAILPLLDALTPVAGAIGAVNTVYRKDGRLVGDNTDAGGFAADLKQFFSTASREFSPEGSDPQQALVLGAGGAARAVAYALLHTGFHVLVTARRAEQAQTLARAMEGALQTRPHPEKDAQSSWEVPGDAPPVIHTIPLTPEALHELPGSIALIVNATPLGMDPHIHACPWPQEVPLPTGAWVYDLVYNPPETALVSLARQAGSPARSGLGMLVEQAALAFKCWTGFAAPRAEMLAAVARHELPEKH